MKPELVELVTHYRIPGKRITACGIWSQRMIPDATKVTCLECKETWEYAMTTTTSGRSTKASELRWALNVILHADPVQVAELDPAMALVQLAKIRDVQQKLERSRE
jgi:hypothetical protein